MKRFCRLVQTDIENVLKSDDKYQYNNLTREERDALNDLCSDSTIIIKKADKGGGIVLLDKSDYVNECRRQLFNEIYYRQLPRDPTTVFQDTVTAELLSCYETGEITKNEYEYMAVKHPVIPTFYTLPKIHKQTTPSPGRPIVSAINSVTCNVSKFVDYHIKASVETMP